MIDTHCHLLPELDDGPLDPEESVALATELGAAGVTAVLCTPHFSRRYPTDHDVAAEKLEEIRSLLAESDLELELRLAAEVGPAAVLDAAEADLRRRAIGGRFLLVELEPDTPAQFLSLTFDRFEPLDLLPVFAHPERCRAIRRDPRPLAEARERRAVVQVVAPSLSGAWGSAVAHAAWTFVASGQADIVASDAHRPGREREALAPVLQALESKLGSEETKLLTEDAPSRLWRGDDPRESAE